MYNKMKNLKHYFEKARKEGWAIGQFNFSTASQINGIVEAARGSKSPIILGTSENESKFFGLKQAVAYRDILREETGLPIFLNLDHGKSFEYLKQAIDAGYDMVHFDGSKLPLEDSPRGEAGNIKITRDVVKYAHWRGVLVEGEVGKIGTDASKVYTENFEIEEDDLTKPNEAKEYMERAEVDLLAVSIGNFHGMLDSGQEPKLRLDRLEEIGKVLGKKMFVLHGGSGTNGQDVRRAIELGIVKININTELRLAYTSALRAVLNNDVSEIVPYKYLPKIAEAVKMVVIGKIVLFNSGNKI